MAMFEREGYCPSNSFGHMLRGMEDQDMAVKVMRRFGDRIGYMVYAEHEAMEMFHEEFSSIVEACKNPILALRLADILSILVPECVYAEKGRKILIHDTINPWQAAQEYIVETRTGYSFVGNGGMKNSDDCIVKKDSKYLVQDLKWLLVIDDGDGEDTINIRIARLTV